MTTQTSALYDSWKAGDTQTLRDTLIFLKPSDPLNQAFEGKPVELNTLVLQSLYFNEVQMEREHEGKPVLIMKRPLLWTDGTPRFLLFSETEKNGKQMPFVLIDYPPATGKAEGEKPAATAENPSTPSNIDAASAELPLSGATETLDPGFQVVFDQPGDGGGQGCRPQHYGSAAH